MRVARTLVLLAGPLALTLTGPRAVRAEDPAHVVLDLTYLVYAYETSDPMGTFTLSGTYEDSGACTQTSIVQNADGSYTSTHELTGADGTIVVELDIGAAYHAYWYSLRRIGVFTVVDGTGTYGDLVSSGETLATTATSAGWGGGGGIPSTSYTQTVYHLDSDPPENVAPTAGLTASANTQPTSPPYSYALYASAWDQDGMPVKFEWDYTGDGIWDADTGNVASTTCTYPGVGTYNPVVRVTDDDGATVTATVQVVVSAPPTVTITSPTNGSTVSGTVAFSASVTNATTVSFHVDGSFVGTATGSASVPWTGSVAWNTTTVGNGMHTLMAVATGPSMLTANVSIQVTVNNATPPPPALAVTAVAPGSMAAGSTVQVTVTGTGFQPGATLSFANGPGPAPTVSGTSVASTTTLNASVSVSKSGPKGSRVWDVVVTNPGGQSGVLTAGFTVVK
jgi:hypothetical protein